MNRPTVALIIEGTYPWYRGGVSEWVSQYLSAFGNINFRLVQVATDPYLQADLKKSLYPVPDNVIDFVRIPPPALNADWQQEAAIWFGEYREELGALFSGADLIHAANTGFAGWLGSEWSRATGIPFVLTEHALYWKEVEQGAAALECGYRVPDGPGAKQQMADTFYEMACRVYCSADEVISVSRCNMAEQQEAGVSQDKHHYIPNGVNRGWLEPDKKRGDYPVIGWIGRCAEMKNPRRFLRFVDAWLDRGLPGRFIMMICDANEPVLQKQVERDAATYPELQLVCNQPAENHIEKMDALCISSHNESQPLVLFEALSKKILPFGWQAGDVTDEFGLVVPQPTEEKVLADQLWSLWQQPEQWRQLVDPRYRLVEKRHTWPAIFNRYGALFEPYLGGAYAG